VQAVVFNPIRVYRLKSSEADMQSDLGSLDTAVPDECKNFWREVQPCGWRRDGAAFTRVNRLIAFSITRAVWPVDIGRQWNMPQALHQTKEIRCRAKLDAALTEASPGYDFGLQFVFPKEKALAHPNFAAGADQALPFIWFQRYLPGEQHLDLALEEVTGGWIPRAHGLRFGSASPGIEACRKDPRVIEYNQVIRPEQIGKVTKPAILQAA